MTGPASPLAPLLPASPVAAAGPRSASAGGASAAEANSADGGFAATLERARTLARPAQNAAHAPAGKTTKAAASTGPAGDDAERVPTQGIVIDSDDAHENAAPVGSVDESPACCNAILDTNPNPNPNPNRDPIERGSDLAHLLPGWPGSASAAAATVTADEATCTGGQEGTAATPALENPRDRPLPTPRAGLAMQALATSDAAAARPGSASSRETELPNTATEIATRHSERPQPQATIAASALAAPAAPRELQPPGMQAAGATANTFASAFDAHLAAAVESAAFAPALATQVAWLVRDGVTQARLSLNPAEMGPVAVQIVLDGNFARVDFSAELAATRAAIEASLPTLAAALQDSGLTLAEGGVFDGRPRHGASAQTGTPAQAPSPGQARAADAAAAALASSGPMRAARGLVDLVA